MTARNNPTTSDAREPTGRKSESAPEAPNAVIDALATVSDREERLKPT